MKIVAKGGTIVRSDRGNRISPMTVRVVSPDARAASTRPMSTVLIPDRTVSQT